MLNETRGDPQNMLRRIQEFPEQCQIAWDRAGDPPLPNVQHIDRVAIFGMGGSAIGGDLVRGLTETDAKVPITVVRDYTAPGWVNDRTLAIAASFSGGTEETIAALAGAITAGATIIGLTGGGSVERSVRQAGGSVVPVSYDSQPRAALAHLFLPLLRTFGRLGFIDDRSAELGPALSELAGFRDQLTPDVPDNLAMQIAREVSGGLAVVVAGGHLAPVGSRWKGQINENAKSWAIFEPLPEMNHNAVVGFAGPATVADLARVLFLDSPRLHPRIRLRIRATAALLGSIPHRVVTVPGSSAIADQLAMIHLGDWVSYYLAMIGGVDPTPVEPIDRLKAVLASEG